MKDWSICWKVFLSVLSELVSIASTRRTTEPSLKTWTNWKWDGSVVLESVSARRAKTADKQFQTKRMKNRRCIWYRVIAWWPFTIWIASFKIFTNFYRLQSNFCFNHKLLWSVHKSGLVIDDDIKLFLYSSSVSHMQAIWKIHLAQRLFLFVWVGEIIVKNHLLQDSLKAYSRIITNICRTEKDCS